MPTYNLHILNWEVEGDSPEDAVRNAIELLKEEDGPEDFVWVVTPPYVTYNSLGIEIDTTGFDWED